ncbi:MAG: hypothetical protein IKK53_03865 [Ruminiclostridium sp.]|nr:hypothetical protein [Ruminiclostridium sp.]
MKKLLALVMSSLFVLTACAGEGNSKVSETQATTVTTTVTTTAETTTTTAAPEPPMTVLQVEDMTVKLDPAVWETFEEYVERMEKKGTPVDPEDKKDFESGEYGRVFVLRDTDWILLIDTFVMEDRELEGFATREEYEEFAESREGLGIDFKTEIREKNGLLFLDNVTSDGGSYYTQTSSIIKDNIHYLFVFGGFEKKTEREYLYDIIENLSFE